MSEPIERDEPASEDYVPNPIEIHMYPDDTAGWLARVAPGPATGQVLALLDPARLSQTGRVDAMVAAAHAASRSGTLAALESGRITARHAAAVTDTVAVLDDAQAAVAEKAVLPTPARIGDPVPVMSSFRKKLRRAADKADPRSAAERAARAAADRDVWCMPDRDAMAFVGAPLPAEGEQTVMAAVSAKAEQIKEPDDPRTKAQRRADGLVQLCADYLIGRTPNPWKINLATAVPTHTYRSEPEPYPTDHTRGKIKAAAAEPPTALDTEVPPPFSPHERLSYIRYTGSMTTTIKVSTEVRDRLKAQAAAAHRTLGEHLAMLAELGDRQTRFDALRAAIHTTPPELLASYRDEVAAWERLDRG